MKTITFYSYKGGVGRSLALSNIAIRLSEFNKKVCILDFDLEAPGLQFKFKNYKKSKPIEKGLVDYIHSFSCEKVLQKKISDYSIKLKALNGLYKDIDFIPAGNIDTSDYWKKLSAIHWGEMFQDNGNGLDFFLDLKAKIERELQPDFLLIDSRTGITDIAGITLRILADEVVILAANNEENKEGSIRIMNSIADPDNSLFGNAPKIHFILTRLPFTSKPEDRLKESNVLQDAQIRICDKFGISQDSFLVIHSDRRLEETEVHLIGYDYEANKDLVSISRDYLNLFKLLTKDILSEAEVEGFNNIRLSSEKFYQATSEKDANKRLQLLDAAIQLTPRVGELHIYKGFTLLSDFGNSKEALKSLEMGLKLKPNDPFVLGGVASAYEELKQHEKALHYYTLSIEYNPSHFEAYSGKVRVLEKEGRLEESADLVSNFIELYGPLNDAALNTRAHIYRKLGRLNEAEDDIIKAIDLLPSNGLYFGTLAEIKAANGSKKDFLFNLNIALSRGMRVREMRSATDIYIRYKEDLDFLTLLSRYNISTSELFGGA